MRLTRRPTICVVMISRRSGCCGICVPQRCCTSRREVIDEQRLELGRVGKRRGQDGLLERDLGVSEKDGNLGRGQAAAHLRAFREALLVGQELDAAIEPALGLKVADHLGMGV